MSTAVSKDSAQVTPEPAPQYNGTLRQIPGAQEVYLVLNGLACWVPDPTTLQNLFGPNPTITPDSNLGAVKTGDPLTSGAVLGQAIGTAPCYLVTNEVKMWIPDSDTFNAYNFYKQNIQFVAPILIDFIPTSSTNVEGPTS